MANNNNTIHHEEINIIRNRGIGSLVCLLSFSQSKEAEKTVQDTNVAQPTVAADSNQIDDDSIYLKVEKTAEFPGGNTVSTQIRCVP